jgi:hypothetical protein
MTASINLVLTHLAEIVSVPPIMTLRSANIGQPRREKRAESFANDLPERGRIASSDGEN